MPPLSQYSEPVVDPMWFAVWCYVVAWLVIIIICIECPPRFVRFWTIWCNKCGISLLGLMFCITFKFSLMRGRFKRKLYLNWNHVLHCRLCELWQTKFKLVAGARFTVDIFRLSKSPMHKGINMSKILARINVSKSEHPSQGGSKWTDFL